MKKEFEYARCSEAVKEMTADLFSPSYEGVAEVVIEAARKAGLKTRIEGREDKFFGPLPSGLCFGIPTDGGENWTEGIGTNHLRIFKKPGNWVVGEDGTVVGLEVEESLDGLWDGKVPNLELCSTVNVLLENELGLPKVELVKFQSPMVFLEHIGYVFEKGEVKEELEKLGEKIKSDLCSLQWEISSKKRKMKEGAVVWKALIRQRKEVRK